MLILDRTMAACEAMWRAARKEDAKPWDWRPAFFLLLAAVVLLLINFCANPEFYRLHLHWFTGTYRASLEAMCYWACACSFAYIVIPVLLMRAAGLKLADFGFLPFYRGSSFRPYLALAVPVWCVVFLASFSHGFASFYPLYGHAGRSWADLVLWELSYLLQFIGIEFFFRGVLLFSLRRYFGSYAIFIAVVPYCMIHFVKPMPEALGSIVAGLVLGTLALGTGSIWGGVFLHMSVALEMDLLALIHQGHFPPGH